MTKRRFTVRPVPTEAQEQTSLVKWASTMPLNIARFGATARIGDLLFSVPNGGVLLSKRSGGVLRNTGLKAGVPDLFFALPYLDKPGLFIEMKRRKGSTLQASQREWIKRLRLSGYVVVVCKGWDEARNAIMDYLGRAEQ